MSFAIYLVGFVILLALRMGAVTGFSARVRHTWFEFEFDRRVSKSRSTGRTRPGAVQGEREMRGV